MLGEVQRQLARHGVATQRSGGRTPLDLTIAEAARITDREALAAWSDRAVNESDPLRRRVGEEVERYLAADVPGGLRSWLDTSASLDDVADVPARDAVSLLTLHSAKGREWGSVVLLGVEDRLIPHSSAVSADQRAEESRLLYVGITRAASNLLITHAARRGAADAQPSPWLDAVAATASADIATASPLPRRPRVQDPLAELKAWRAGVSRAAGVSDQAICTDRVLRSLLESPPENISALAGRLGISPEAAARLRPLPHLAGA